jgi:hypothetical protein
MKTGNRLIGAVLGSLLLFTGCEGVEGGPSDLGGLRTPDQSGEVAAPAAGEIEKVQQKLGAPGSLNPLPPRGGTGGRDFGIQEGGIIYGIRVNSGDRIDRIQLAYYIPSHSDNQYRDGDLIKTIGPFGGDGGDDSGWHFCPAGYGAIGLQGASGKGIDRVGLICGKIDNLDIRDSAMMLGNGNGGTPFHDICGQPGFLSGIRGKAGKELDRLQGQCRAAN